MFSNQSETDMLLIFSGAQYGHLKNVLEKND